MSPRTLKQSVKLGAPSRVESFRLAEAIFDALEISEESLSVTKDSPAHVLDNLPPNARLELMLLGRVDGFHLHVKGDMDKILGVCKGTHLEGHADCIHSMLECLSEAVKIEQGQCDPIFIVADYIHGHCVTAAAKETPEPEGDMVTSSNEKTIH